MQLFKKVFVKVLIIIKKYGILTYKKGDRKKNDKRKQGSS